MQVYQHKIKFLLGLYPITMGKGGPLCLNYKGKIIGGETTPPPSILGKSSPIRNQDRG